MLRRRLGVAWGIGLDQVLVTCDDANVASIGVIEACGGRLESVVDIGHEGAAKRPTGSIARNP
jgi:predicted acetyltransferase